MPTCGEHTSLAILGAQQDETRHSQGQASGTDRMRTSAPISTALDNA